jgi:M6 family metalloprotease-like protein
MSAIFGEMLTFPQENGLAVDLVVFGDEFYSRYETRDGFTVLYDSTKGLYCYATLQDGRLVSSGAPISKRPPEEIRPGLRDTPTLRNQKFGQRYHDLRDGEIDTNPAINRTLGPSDGLLTGRRVSQGKIRGLTILVEFADLSSEVTPADVDAMLNGENYQENGNFCSVREYFRLMSNGKLDYTNQVVGPVKLSQPQRYYVEHLLCKEALDKVVNELGVNLSQFDSRGEGVVDALSFMYAGRTLYEGNLWPHNATLNLRYNGIRINFYTIQSLGRQRVDLSIGTFCHESGHLLCRFPDLYDYGTRDGDFEKSGGMGYYCLMSAGNHLNQGRTPAAICGYLRDLVGWCDRTVSLNTSGLYDAKHSDYGTLLKYKTRRSNEYFIVENRTQRGLDTHLPDGGLAVYHCDILGSNEWQGGTADRHYQCGLLQADGHLDLENNRNLGDAGDFFTDRHGVALTFATTPSSRAWDGTDSGLALGDIPAAAEVMRIAVGAVEPPDVVRRETVADLLIPDNKPEGISSPIAIDQMGTVKTVKVGVDLTHTYIGDLQVALQSPAGTTVMLHNRTGRASRDIKATYSFDTTPDLARFSQESLAGTWQLLVKDLASRDVGRLNRWSIEIGYETSEQAIHQEVSPNLEIPDKDAGGVSSVIAIATSGTVKAIAVEVAIQHTYIGDLLVDLVAPSGQTVTLHNMAGGSQDNLHQTYDPTSAPALETLVGQPLQGDWTLRVKDLQKMDVGRLEKWALHLKY